MGAVRVLSVLRGLTGLDEYPLLRALMASGCDLVNIDDRLYGFHEVPNVASRAERSINRPAYVQRLNDDLVRYIQSHRPELLLMFKAPHVRASTVQLANSIGCRTVCIYPDLDPRVEGAEYLEMLRTVDEFHFTKPHLTKEFRSAVRADAKVMFPMYSRLEIGEPGPIDPAIGVSFVGHHSPGKERSLRTFQGRYRGALTIIGDGWRGLTSTHSPISTPCTVRPALYGGVVRSVYRHSLCTLGLLMESRSGGWGGDEVTSRSVLVPATGGLLLHPRNPTSAALYGSSSALLYDHIDQAADIAHQLAAEPGERARLAHDQRESVLRHASCAEAIVESWLA